MWRSRSAELGPERGRACRDGWCSDRGRCLLRTWTRSRACTCRGSPYRESAQLGGGRVVHAIEVLPRDGPTYLRVEQLGVVCGRDDPHARGGGGRGGDRVRAKRDQK